MITTIPIDYGKYYHIYNRGINGCEIFKERTNYEHFLALYEKYIPLIAETFAWVLMGNHFHFLVRINEEKEIDVENLTRIPKTVRFNFITPDRPSQQFSNLFNAYSKGFNKMYDRTGGLFERPFKRKEIGDDYYLKLLIYYIHHNPIHHGVVSRMNEYMWSSFGEIYAQKEPRFQVLGIVEWLFDNRDNFLSFHQQEHDTSEVEDY